jgi:hypothetical protein
MKYMSLDDDASKKKNCLFIVFYKKGKIWENLEKS